MNTLNDALAAVAAYDSAMERWHKAGVGDEIEAGDDAANLENIAQTAAFAYVRTLAQPPAAVGEAVAWRIKWREGLYSEWRAMALLDANDYRSQGAEIEYAYTHPPAKSQGVDDAYQPHGRERDHYRLLYGFILDCNAIGPEEAGRNLARSIKEVAALAHKGNGE